MKSGFGLLLALAMWFHTGAAFGDDAKSSLRYTFSWPLSDGDALKPRGGSTRGPAVVLDKAPSREWLALQAPNLSARERDRLAILAMAGTYRVTFDFLEITPFANDKPQPPYQSWGTEKVYVDENSPTSISLVHILEMRVIETNGNVSEPMVTKHWRQDWKYEPDHIVEYAGRDQWRVRKLSRAESRGKWSQTVYQVDESPRYASLGAWQHSKSFSSWLSGDTWRPLPRREWSVRDDYQVLAGTNRHTINASGWVQEENNLKTVLDADRRIDASQPYVAREYGVARYARIQSEGFAEADDYFERTKQFWKAVRDAWSQAFTKHSQITLRGPVDKLGLFRPLFAKADEIASGETAENTQGTIHSALQAMGVPD